MKIIVLVKVVEFVYAQTGTDIAKNYIGEDDTLRILNPLDEMAIELALSIRERLPTTEVRMLCLGDPSMQPVLQRGLAHGVHGATLITAGAGQCSDAWTRAIALAEFLRGQTFDLIVAGQQGIDGHEGITAAYVAELLELPQVNHVVDVEDLAEGRQIVVHRLLERGNKQVIECRLPALLTVAKGLGTLRYPTLAGILAAQQKPVETVVLEHLATPGSAFGPNACLTRIKRVTNPKPKRKREPPAAQKRSASARLSFLMKGKKVQEKKTSRFIQADSEEALLEIERVLKENGNLESFGKPELETKGSV